MYREKCVTNPCNILLLHTIFIWDASTMHQFVAYDIVYLSLQTNKHTWTLIANLIYLMWTKLQDLCGKSGDFQSICQNQLKDMTCLVTKNNWVSGKNIECNATNFGELVRMDHHRSSLHDIERFCLHWSEINIVNSDIYN
jgi:hypothetical protein